MENKVKSIIRKHAQQEEIDHIALLQEIQGEFSYVPPEALQICAEELGFPLNKLYSVVTFYSCFSLIPRGKKEIQVCMGTACHVRGAPRILNELSRKLNLEPGETGKDGNFTLETVNCLGACAIGPLVNVNGQYRGNLTVNQVENLLEREGRKKYE